jgi:hypothetical protein
MAFPVGLIQIEIGIEIGIEPFDVDADPSNLGLPDAASGLNVFVE